GGEDVLLGRLFAAARVQGFQGTDLKSTEHLLACIKHFAAYGAGESGLDYNAVDMSEQRLREVYLQPYKAGFDAGALSAMASFNEINGVPSTGNHWLQTDLLRGEWGFRGFVVSDYTGDEEMIAAGFAKDGRDAARLAFLARVGPQVDRHAQERGRAPAASPLGQAHCADRTVRRWSARPRRTLGGLRRRHQSGGPRDRHACGARRRGFADRCAGVRRRGTAP